MMFASSWIFVNGLLLSPIYVSSRQPLPCRSCGANKLKDGDTSSFEWSLRCFSISKNLAAARSSCIADLPASKNRNGVNIKSFA